MSEIEKKTEEVQEIPTFYMMVGLPGSGKSTYAKTLKVPVHSSDQIRELRKLDPANPQDNTEVFNRLHKNVIKTLRKGRSCVMDATNLRRKQRMHFLKKLKDIPCYKECVLMVTPPELCKKRNLERDRQVPDNVIDDMLRGFDIPGKCEGWNETHVCITEMEEGYSLPWNEIDNMVVSGESAPMSLHAHHNKAYYEGGIKDSPLNDTVLTFAITNHDIGKYYVQPVYKNGEACYPGHENVGAYYYLCALVQNYVNDLESLANALKAAELISWHMRPYIWDKSAGARENDRKLIGEEMYQQLVLLHKADLAAQ